MPSDTRLDVRKTYKLYIGGAFPRSESGRSYVVSDAKGKFLANASQASRKDARDAVKAARSAFGGWSARTAYNRGQVVYRIAEVLEGRRAQFEDELRVAEGVSAAKARQFVDAAIDRLVWYAGWSDKIAQVTGGANPVAGPYFNHSAPEPTGVVAVVAPKGPLLGLVSVVAPLITTGNTCVVIASERAPADGDHARRGDGHRRRAGRRGQHPHRPARRDRALARLAHGRQRPRPDRHRRPRARDRTSRPRPPRTSSACAAPATRTCWHRPGLDRMTQFLETKTVWHPIGI